LYIGAMIAVTFGMTMAFEKNETYIYLIGLCSSSIEALLGIP